MVGDILHFIIYKNDMLFFLLFTIYCSQTSMFLKNNWIFTCYSICQATVTPQSPRPDDNLRGL